MDAKVLLVVDYDEPNLGLLERVLRSGGETAFHARAVVSRDLELRPVPVLLILQLPRIAP